MQVSEQVSEPNDKLRAQTAKIIDYFVLSVGFAALPMAMLIIYFANKFTWGIPEYLEIASIGAILLVAFFRHSLAPVVQAHAVVFCLFVAALADVSRYGLMTATTPLLAILPVMSTVVGGMRTGLLTTGVITIAMIGLAASMISSGQLPPNYFPEMQLSGEDWAFHISTLAIAASIAVLVTGSLYHFQQRSSKELRSRDEKIIIAQSRILRSAELAGLGYAVIDPRRGRVVECDASYAEMHGLTVDEMLKLDIKADLMRKIVHEDDRKKAAQTFVLLSAGTVVSDEFRHHLPNGEVRTIRKVFSPLSGEASDVGLMEVVGQDVSDARKLQSQLFQSQKMDAIGKLTGGVAHDFNNLLAVTLGNLELLEDDVTGLEQKKLIKNSIESTLRGAELTRNMLSFARQAPLEPSLIDLNQLVRNMKNWIGRTLPSTIDVETSLLAGLWEIEVDPSSTEAGLLNLILNARDAMPSGGKLTIETSNVRIDDDYIELRGEDVVAGRYVMLAVSDTGEGISSENLARIFEPFFTTKPVGAGSGLGLSMIEGFMRQSQGAVRVYSESGVGTTFKLYFKASETSRISKRAPQHLDVENNAESRPKILLVEDNLDVMEALQIALSKSGYHVIQACSGDDAFEIFQNESNIDLLLTDIVMPGELQGTTLAKALRELQQDLPVMFMSGYANEATVHGNGLRPEDIRLMKPVRREDLLRAVNKALSKKVNGS